LRSALAERIATMSLPVDAVLPVVEAVVLAPVPALVLALGALVAVDADCVLLAGALLVVDCAGAVEAALAAG
jgi:hypothetical protein